MKVRAVDCCAFLALAAAVAVVYLAAMWLVWPMGEVHP